MKLAVALTALVTALLLTTVPAIQASPGAGVSWQAAASDADVDRYFAQARVEKKPVLLYWGAKWCPPCNQLKATLFNRADFIEQSKAFVAIGIDGDAPGAQRLGTRFKVQGYPTLILLNPNGNEITRLPGEADAAQVMKVLQLGLSSGRPVKAVLADAMAGRKLSTNEWRMLGFYSWDTDEQQLVTNAKRAATLARLAKASEGSDFEATTRLWLKSIGETESGKADPGELPRLHSVLTSAVQARAQMDVLTNGAPDLVKAFAPQPGPTRDKLVAAFDAALQRLNQDQTLARADRLGALLSRVELARLDVPAKELRPSSIPAPLVAEVREQVAKLDRELTNSYERQAVIPGASQLLARTGLWTESDDLLKAELVRSHSAYYLMGHLAGNAKRQGRRADALHWYKEAFNASEGPATRLQWGTNYVAALVELSPEDASSIEAVAAQLFAEAGKDPGSFYERSQISLKRLAGVLAKWNQGSSQAAVVDRLKSRLDAECGKLGAGDARAKTACEGLMR